jgi:hypothetical protein
VGEEEEDEEKEEEEKRGKEGRQRLFTDAERARATPASYGVG